MRLAAFDLDGTLVRGDLVVPCDARQALGHWPQRAHEPTSLRRYGIGTVTRSKRLPLAHSAASKLSMSATLLRVSLLARSHVTSTQPFCVIGTQQASAEHDD